MRRYVLLVVLCTMTSTQASYAQLNIRTDQGDVSIGSDGINVRQGGRKVNINNNSIYVNQSKHHVRVRPEKTTNIQTVTSSVGESSPLQGKDMIFDNSGFKGQVTCTGGNVVLNASACSIKVTGPINALVLNGSSNKITCDAVHHVQVNGSANDVNWSHACNPSVANAGSANTLKAR